MTFKQLLIAFCVGNYSSGHGKTGVIATHFLCNAVIRMLSFIVCNNICRCYHLLCGYALLLRLIWKILVRDESSPNIQSTKSPTIYTEATVHHENTWTSLIRNLNTLFFLFFYECETIYTMMIIKRSDLTYRTKRSYLNYCCLFLWFIL